MATAARIIPDDNAAELAAIVAFHTASRAALTLVESAPQRLDISMLSARNQGVMQAYISGTEDTTTAHYRAAKGTRDYLFAAYGSGDVLLVGKGK
jgi:hypothetical protein